jgi:hypothetical protein
LTVYYDDRRIIIIPYEPVDDRAWVNGEDIRLARKIAGIKTTYHMATRCQWSQSTQMYYEGKGRKKIDLFNVWTMIRVCNGENSPPHAAGVTKKK